MTGRAWLIVFGVVAIAACDRKAPAPVDGPGTPTTSAPSAGPTGPAMPAVPKAIEGDPRDAARALLGVPPKPGREVGTVESFSNADPQVNAAGVLAATGANGRVITVYATEKGIEIGGPIDLGAVRYLATDGPNVCASDRKSLRCARVDGSEIGQRSTGSFETTGVWGGPGVIVRATSHGMETGLEASDNGFMTARRVAVPARRAVVSVYADSAKRWTCVLLPTEGTVKPRYGLTVDGGVTPIADFGALDRVGWGNGDRLWPDQLVTGPFSTETIVAERGEKQSAVKLPWPAAGGFAFARHSLLLFGRNPSGHGGLMLLEFPSRHVTVFSPPGAQAFVAAGRVGGSIVGITTEGKVLAWD